MGPSDTGESGWEHGNEPTSALSTATPSASELKSTEQTTPDLSRSSENVVSSTIADGDSALGSVSEAPGPSGTTGHVPATQEVGLDVDVRMSNPNSNIHADIY